MSHCTGKNSNRNYGEAVASSGVANIKQESIFNLDYVLLQSGHASPKFEVTPSGRVRRTQSVMFDVGTSRFDSSLFWFTCGYSQVPGAGRRAGHFPSLPL